MAMQNVFNIRVDLKAERSISKPKVTQNDSVVFVLEVMENGVAFDLTDTTTISLAHARRGGTVVVTEGTRVGNIATFELGTNVTAIIGDVTAKAQFYDAAGRVSTLSFSYQVTEDPTGSGYIPDESEQTLIQVVLNDGPLIIASAEEAAAYANEQGDYALQVGVDNETRYLNAVSSVALRDSTYPLPAHGDTVRITELGRTDRYVLGAGWVTTDVYNPVVIDELSQQLADTNYYAKTPNLHNDFAGKLNGAITVLDTGQPFRIYDNPSSSSGLAISSGAMAHGVPSANSAAGYLEVTLTNKITRIGAKFKYSDITYGGSVTVASFASSIVEAVVDNGQPIPSAGIHVTLNPSYIGVTIYQSTGTIQLGDIPISGLQANKEYSFEVIVDRENNTLYVVKPDGTLSKGFTDSRISSMSSEFATFELYEVNTTKIPAVITSVWADDKTYNKDGSNLNTLDIFKALATNYNTVDQNGYVKLVTDANSADKSGFYYSNTNTPNAPTTDSYFFFTQKANNLYAVQYAYRLNADIVYRRALRNGVWGAWIQVPQSKEIATDDNGHGVVITDANNVAMSGYYQSSGSVLNAPTASGGYVYHVLSTSSQYKIMYAWNLSSGIRYKRSMSAGTWSAWVTVTE